MAEPVAAVVGSAAVGTVAPAVPTAVVASAAVVKGS